ncbi:unnamed protein product [Paramecium sonneborni]|uniref:Uncharacterized protein n=1 Tax=Paramecium sonneborni TaxID=65129 RepID=A0A8S1RG12_9CILI|nr:unnamed protein product [Paramecium sonneborni]
MIQHISIHFSIALLLIQLMITAKCKSECPFTKFKDAILSIETSSQTYTQSINNNDNLNTFGFAFWSISIPLIDKLQNVDRDAPFNNDVSEDGELLFLIKDLNSNTNFCYGFKSYDYQNRQVKHTIKFMNQDSSQIFVFPFQSLEYEGIWIFHLILLQPTLHTIKVQISSQDKQSTNFNLQNQLNLQISLGGRGYIDDLNLNSNKGLMSKLIYLPAFAYSTNIYSEMEQNCKIPPKIINEQILDIVPGIRIFQGNQVLQLLVDHYGNRYCLSGWVKILLSTIDEQRSTIIKMTGQQNFEQEIVLGDELFRLEVIISKNQPEQTQLIVNADAYGMPIKQSFQQQYDLLFQGSVDPNYSVLQVKRIYQDINSQLYFEGLQQWHFIQYEYGRNKFDERMLLKIQFSNGLGLLQENLGNDIFSGSFTNSKFNLFIGSDTINNLNNNFLQAQIYDLKMQFNYNEDKEFNQNCHPTCLSCNGPLDINCLSCDSDLNRFYQVELRMCKCNAGYYDKGYQKCENEFYSSIKLEELEIDSKVNCPFGYFRLPKEDGNGFDCLECPQVINFKAVLCVDCYFYAKTWYLRPVCKMDYYTIKQVFNDYEAYHLITRSEIQRDVYSIESDRLLHINPGFADYCKEEKECYEFLNFHLGQQIKAYCKPNHYFSEDIQRCINPGMNCLKVNILKSCEICPIGTYNNYYTGCNNCPSNCYACSYILYQKVICEQCVQYYTLQNEVCKQCGLRCDVCKDYYDTNLGLNYLRCLKCIDDSQYLISFDGINCVFNNIQHCKHAFQIINDDYTINTLDINFTPQYDQSKIKLFCAKCEPNYVFVFETQQCVYNDQNSICDTAIGQLKSNDQSLESITCLKSFYYENQVVEFMEKCSLIINNCQVCLETNILNYFICLECYNGFYAEQISGQCVQCPIQLNCYSCYSQNSISKDHWKQQIRAFYRKYIEIKNTHQYILNAQSPNILDYEVVCQECKDGYRLYKNKCIKYCSDSCIECLLKDDQYYCVKCQNDSQGRQQSTYNNECIQCPEDCALCRPRTPDEIKEINPLFNNTKYEKYTHQCILSYQDQNYNYDVDLGVFIECKQHQSNGCYKQLVIQLKAYGDSQEYDQDYAKLIDEQSQLQFKRQNIKMDSIFYYQINSIFQEYENDEFYFLANANHIKSILIQITNTQPTNYVGVYLQKGGITQNFSQNIFSLINVEIELNFLENTQLALERDMLISFINFNKVTLQNLKILGCKYCEDENFIFKSIYPQSIILKEISVVHYKEFIQEGGFNFTFENAKTLFVDGLTLIGFQYEQLGQIFYVQNTSFQKQIKINNIQFINCEFNNHIFFHFQLGYDDTLIFDHIQINGNYNSVNLIEIESEDQKGGQIEIKNVIIEEATIIDSKVFLNFEKVRSLSISNFKVNNAYIKSTNLIILNRNAFLENLEFLDSQIMDNSYLIQNTDLKNNQLDINYKINEIKFENNQYNSLIKFINLKKYSSLNQLIEIKQLNQINNILIVTNIEYNLKQEDSSLIFIQFNKVYITDFLINRGLGINDISITESEFIQFQNGILLQDKQQFLGLHKHIACQLLYVEGQQYSTSLNILFSISIVIQNVTFSKVESYNFPFIFINSADLMKEIQDTNIILKDLVFSQNLVLLSKSLFQTSIVTIQSSQQTVIQIQNVTFKNNILHVYIEDGLIIASGLLLINCPSCIIQIQYSTFQNNLVTNSSSSIMYMNSQKLEINNCIFENNSIFIYNVIQPYLIWAFSQTITQKTINSFFQVKSESGIMQIIVQQLNIYNNSFQNSAGQLGGCFSIHTLRSSTINIKNNIFSQISTQFDYEIEQGGVLYIDGSSSSLLEIEISNITVQNVYCRQYGGFLYLKSNTSQAHLTLNNIILHDIYAQQGSVIYVSYSRLVKEKQTIFLQGLEIVNSQSGYLQFFNRFKELSNSQEINSLINNRTSIFVEYGSKVLIQNISVNHLIFESLLNLQNINFIYISDIKIEECELSNNLIYMTPITFFNLIRTQFRQIRIGFDIQDFTCNSQPQSNEIINYQCLNGFGGAPISLVNDLIEKDTQRGECISKSLKSKLDLSNSGLIIINNLNQGVNLKISQLDLNNISCTNCSNGLLYMKFIGFKQFLQTQLIIYPKVTISDCGQNGCLVFEKQYDQNRRILTEEQNIFKGYELQISDYICENNQGKTGTCLMLDSIFTLILNSVLKNNTASTKGGAIHVKGQEQLILENSLIQNNKAEVGGGLYLENAFALNYELLKTRIIFNTANFYGDNIASIPEKLAIRITQNELLQKKIIVDNSSIKIEEIVIQPYTLINGKSSKFVQLPTGQKISTYQFFNWKNNNYINYDLIFRIHAMNRRNNQIQDLSNSYCTINSRRYNISENDESQEFQNNYTNNNSIQFNSQSQDYNLDNLIVYFDNEVPEDIVLQLEFNCDQVKVPIYNNTYPYQTYSYHSNYKLRINIKTLECQFGEIKNITDQSCEKCNSIQGLFSLTLNAQKCDIQDDLSTISVTQNQLELRSGYWRPYFDTIQISYCLNLPSNCLGGWQNGDISCYIGHIGALCEQCDLYNIRGGGQFSIVNRYSCGTCQDKYQNIAIIIGIIILTLILLQISVKGTLKSIEEYTKFQPFKISQYSLINKPQSSILIKMLTNYFQIVATITTFQLQFPSGFNVTLDAVGNPIQTATYSLDCFLVDISNTQIQYSRMIWQIILSILYVNIFMALFFIAHKLNLTEISINRSVISTTLIYFYIYFQPNLINGFVQQVSYRSISGFQWIKANVAERYDTNAHLKWMLQFCLPVLIILSIAVPFFFLYGLFTNKTTLDSKQTRLRWAYLYIEYKKNAYFWELVKIFEKELIILSLIYYEDNIVIKGVLVLLITYFYQELNQNYEPYQLNSLNQLDYYSANICMITICLAVGAYISQQADLKELKISFFVIMAFLNFLFLQSILSKIISEYSKQYESILDSIRDFIKSKYPSYKNSTQLRRILQNRTERRQKAIQSFQKLKRLAFPLVRLMIQTRNQSFAKSSKEKSNNVIEIHTKQDTLEFEKSSQKRLLIIKNNK